jgi:hypothetical protein
MTKSTPVAVPMTLCIFLLLCSGATLVRFSFGTSTIPIELKSPIPQQDGYFGNSVAVGSDLVVVGAPQDNASGVIGAGDAYIFNSTTGKLIGTLVSPNPQPYALFGNSVAVSGDNVLVGAPFESVTFGGTTYNFAGRAYVFNLETHSNLTLTNPLIFSGYCSDQIGEYCDGYFGWSVAINGSSAVIGAFHEDQMLHSNVQGDAGAAYIFNADDGETVASLSSPNMQSDGFFGYSVSVGGGVVVVGASGEAPSGNVYTFTTSGTLVSTLALKHPKTGEAIGQSVSTDGELIAIGAPSSSMPSDSAAYTFNATTSKQLKTFGYQKQDGGVPFGDSISINSGLLMLGPFEFNSKTGSLVAMLNDSSDQKTGQYGESVSLSGTIAIIGAPDQKVKGLTSAGNAFIFDLA